MSNAPRQCFTGQLKEALEFEGTAGHSFELDDVVYPVKPQYAVPVPCCMDKSMHVLHLVAATKHPSC